ncbi:hypothetical protein OHO28_32520 [Streptomyces europaeiscabiei]|uniref:hypothetical protein n=1 Tax=Streptomyces europaeiscabiei TaxID=146819 RepID=UPI002E1775AE
MTEPFYATGVRESYGTIPASWAELVENPAELPVAPRMPTAFAEEVRAGGLGRVTDPGCGPEGPRRARRDRRARRVSFGVCPRTWSRRRGTSTRA